MTLWLFIKYKIFGTMPWSNSLNDNNIEEIREDFIHFHVRQRIQGRSTKRERKGK